MIYFLELAREAAQTGFSVQVRASLESHGLCGDDQCSDSAGHGACPPCKSLLLPRPRYPVQVQTSYEGRATHAQQLGRCRLIASGLRQRV